MGIGSFEVILFLRTITCCGKVLSFSSYVVCERGLGFSKRCHGFPCGYVCVDHVFPEQLLHDGWVGESTRVCVFVHGIVVVINAKCIFRHFEIVGIE